MDNNLNVRLLLGYVLYRLLVELEFMDLDTFPDNLDCSPSLLTRQDTAVLHQAVIV
jgi:hypothetical protein